MERFETFEFVTISGEIATTLVPGEAFKLAAIRFAANSMCASGEFTIRQSGMSGEASSYAVYTQQMGGLSSFGYQFDPAMPFKAGHSLVIAAPNDNDNTYNAEIVWIPVNQ